MSDNTPTNMEAIEKLEAILSEMRAEGEKLYHRNVKASAPKLRKQCQEMKSLCQTVRKQSLEYKNSLPVKGGRGKSAAPAEPAAEPEASE